MELPSLIVFSTFFLWREGRIQPVTWIFFGLYVLHYINRSLIYPFRTKTSGKKMPLLIAVFAIFFNLVNGSLNGLYFSHFSIDYSVEWLYNARFIIGMALFVVGVIINQKSDNYLLSLRNGREGQKTTGEKIIDTKQDVETTLIKSVGNGYKIPRGSMFRFVSCPNFSGEILEWTGFAVMTWSPAVLAFTLWTIFNLLPRALEHHRWYKENFENYPPNRKAVIPFIL